jgi:hypothetical protein
MPRAHAAGVAFAPRKGDRALLLEGDFETLVAILGPVYPGRVAVLTDGGSVTTAEPAQLRRPRS